MARALVQSTRCFRWAVSSGSKIRSKQSGNAKRAVIKVMCSSLQTPPMRVRTFSGVNSLCNMVNKSHDFHSAPAAATSVCTEKASPILPEGVMFTERAKEVIKFVQNEATRIQNGYRFDGTEMILLGLTGDDIDTDFGESTDIAAKVLYSMDICFRDAFCEIFKIICYRSLENPFTPRALRVFELALAEAQELGHNYIGSEHLLLGLLREGGGANHVLRKLGACPINIRTQVMRMIEESAAEVVGDGSSGNEMPTLEEYSVNLTELAEEKKLHPVVEKQPLINTVIQILGRPSKNNPYLIGEAGVGKTSIVEGLAQRIADSDVPDFLSNKKVITLDKRLPVHGRFQERLKKLMEEIKECNEIILFIDDLHTLFEAGTTEGTIDAVNNLIGAVVRGELQCVIATEYSEYPKQIKNNGALERLFQPVEVPEATVDETIEILKGL